MKKGEINKSGILLPGMLCVSCLILFLILTAAVYSNLTLNADKTVLISLRDKNNLSIPIFHSWLLPLMRVITILGNSIWVTIITAALSVYLIIKRKYKLLGIILLAVIGGSFIDLFLKWISARNRPEIVPHLIEAYYYSFPSGHAFISSVLYPAVGFVFIRHIGNKPLKICMLTCLVIIILLIGLSRIYLGVHYPSDVIGGWLIGTSWLLFCWLLSKKIIKYPVQKRL